MICCEYCNPEYYIVYGICPNCKRSCNPPLPKVPQQNLTEKFKRMIKECKKLHQDKHED